jgi:hypothetical protein
MQTRHSERNRSAVFGRVLLKGKLPACVPLFDEEFARLLNVI